MQYTFGTRYDILMTQHAAAFISLRFKKCNWGIPDSLQNLRFGRKGIYNNEQNYLYGCRKHRICTQRNRRLYVFGSIARQRICPL